VSLFAPDLVDSNLKSKVTPETKPMDFIPHYDGSHRGQGRFMPKGSDESYSVTYDLFESSEILRYPGRSEVRRKVQLTGTVAPIPKGLESPSGPHILEMEDGRLLECFIDATGAVKCQDQV
jgi:hypothetical protein